MRCRLFIQQDGNHVQSRSGRHQRPEGSKTLYDALLGPLGYGEGLSDDNDQRRRYVYRAETTLFIITQPINGQPATSANGGTIGFACQSTEQVDQWHAAGVANGGTSAEAPPGVRQTVYGNLYLAYLRDPDGNKLGALYHAPV
ncbi:VOC family protein [Paraburkholderia terrae]|uniref:VOC family protein n=1 Tax=Paraburkholderia terrae TaxID=311230 RepID=A0A2I8EY86_9BURK|nr:VOC family protein [Paraburkholderia terrae]AUT64459.1 VOC family protein [Paraburkholderia terrae]